MGIDLGMHILHTDWPKYKIEEPKEPNDAPEEKKKEIKIPLPHNVIRIAVEKLQSLIPVVNAFVKDENDKNFFKVTKAITKVFNKFREAVGIVPI